MGNTQSNPRVQDAYVWYDEKMRTHFLFCTIDGVEEEGKRISALNAAKVRDGVLTAEQLAEKIYPFLTNGTGKNESEAMQNKADESQITQEKAEPQEAKERTNGRRFMTALNGLVTNYYNNGVRFSAWVADIFTLAWKDDNIGAYKEFAKGVTYAEGQVGKAVDFFRLEDIMAKARTYLLSLYDAGGQVLRGEFGKAREAARPLTDDLRTLGNFVFIRSGVWPMLKNLTNRTLDFAGALFTANRKEAVKTGKDILQGTGQDVKTILHSESAKKTVESVLNGMERLEKATRANNERQRELNKRREEELEIKHPRLSHVRIYANNAGMSHFIRCCIDGVQQMGHPLKEQDYTSWELGNMDRYQLAEKYYANDLKADLGRATGIRR